MINGNILRASSLKIVTCEICGSKVRRTKTFKMFIKDNNIEGAKKALNEEYKKWELTEKQKHCHICWSIKESIK